MATKSKATTEKKLGWHFLPKDMKLEYGDGRQVVVGGTLSIPKSQTPSCCHRGLHASEKPVQAATFKRGPVLTRVEVWGDLDKESDKFCGRFRKVLWAKELTAKDIKACLKSVDYDFSGSTTVDELISELGYASETYTYNDDINEWLLKWAKDNGSEGPIVECVYVKKPLTKEIVKGFLAERLVRTEDEIIADMGEVYDVHGDEGDNSPLYDVLNDLRFDDEACRIDGWTHNGNMGWVLKQKKPTKKKR